jgi:cephalosporin-C deacetylase-like acetyl esterase
MQNRLYRGIPIVWNLVFLLCTPILGVPASEHSYTVLPDDGIYADKEIMLLKHLSRLAQERAWKREVELARITNQEQWEAYKQRLLRDYRDSLGLPFPERTPLNPETVKIIDRGEYRIENILYESMPQIWVTANLYVPQKGGGPFPGILFPCGHSHNGKAYELYHSAALGLVKKGYVVFVYDPPSQGERYQYLKEDGTPEIGKATREHTLLANPMFLIGKHLMAVRLWDAKRGIDYLLQRREVDPARIGCTGNSGGGTVTLHLVPLEERIKVAVPVGTVNAPDMELGTGGIGDGEQNLPMLFPRGITHADLMMLAWPRPYRLIKESQGGVRRGTRMSFVQAQFLYETLGHPERMTYVETERPHGYFQEMREPMYFWFGKWLYGRDNDYVEPHLDLEEESELLCSNSGQILNERGIPLWKWTANQYERNFPKRPIPTRKDHGSFREELQAEAEFLLDNPPRGEVRAEELAHSVEGSVSVTNLVLYSEEDVYLPCVLFRPKDVESIPGILLADSDGKTSVNVALSKRMAEAGFGVLLVDLRGYGETAITQRSSRDEESGYEAQTLGIEAGVAYDGLKLGRSVFAMRVFDLLQAADYLASRDDIDSSRVTLIGRYSCGPLALYAGLLEERLKGVLVDSSLSTFSSLVTSRLYKYHFLDFLPRVLRYHDLPQVAGALAPRVVWMLNLKDAHKEALETSTSRADHSWAEKCYVRRARGESFRIGTYESDADRDALYLEWARAALLAGD